MSRENMSDKEFQEFCRNLVKVSSNIEYLVKHSDLLNAKVDILQEKAVEQAMSAKAAHKRIDEMKDHIDENMVKLQTSLDHIDGSVKKNTNFRERASGIIAFIGFIFAAL
jgi:uncharacterized coiled-coil DUF342 family protein